MSVVLIEIVLIMVTDRFGSFGIWTKARSHSQYLTNWHYILLRGSFSNSACCLFPLMCGQKTRLEKNPNQNIRNALLFVCFLRGCLCFLFSLHVQSSCQATVVIVSVSLLHTCYSDGTLMYHAQYGLHTRLFTK